MGHALILSSETGEFSVLSRMRERLTANDVSAADDIVKMSWVFYSETLKTLVAPWTHRDQTPVPSLREHQSTG
jgi:hypothetical protein